MSKSIPATSRERPAFIITVDTEGDNLWSRPKLVETKNWKYLSRFQKLCEEFGFKPTWLTNYEMVECKEYVEFGRDIIRRNAGEIGMHLHAWNTPPLVPITTDDFYHQPYLIEYPIDVMDEKISVTTELLQNRFETPIVSHRSGRWALDSRYVKLLIKHGYLVDCSVTPGVTWTESIGAPGGIGGSDYRTFPSHPYLIDPDCISRSGPSPLLEVPASVTTSLLYRIAPWVYKVRGIRGYAWRSHPPHKWLYPNGSNLVEMLSVVRSATNGGAPYIEFVIHSSELMPGGAPSLADEAAIERLYDDLQILLLEISSTFVGRTLSEFRRQLLLEQR
jgi:hypothetical protein